MDKTVLSLFGSLFHPDWRESEVQLTEKQVVLLMHDIKNKKSVICYNFIYSLILDNIKIINFTTSSLS